MPFPVACYPKKHQPAAPPAPFAGPLDGHTVGLAAAYLPFRGFTAYTDFGFRGEDLGTADSQEFTFLANGDLNQATTFANTVCKVWYNQAGNPNRDLIANGMDQFEYPFLFGDFLNGHPVLQMTVIGNVSTMLASAALWSGAPPFDRTIYIVARKRTDTTGTEIRPVFSTGDDAEGRDTLIVDYSEVVGNHWWWHTDDGGQLNGEVGNSRDWSNVVVTASGTDTQIYSNGAAGPSFTSFVSPTDPGFNIGGLGGGTMGADIDIAAILIYDAAHDFAKRAAITGILASKFGM